MVKTYEGSPDDLRIFLEDPRNLVHICRILVHQLQVYIDTGQSQDHMSLNVSLKVEIKV